MKCLLHKIIVLLLGGLIPPFIFSAISVGFYDHSTSPQGFCFFYLVGILCMIRFGIYEEVSGKINNRYKKG